MMTDSELGRAIQTIRSERSSDGGPFEDVLRKTQNERIIALVRANTPPQALTCTEDEFVNECLMKASDRVKWLMDHGAVFTKPKLRLKDVPESKVAMTHRTCITGHEFAKIGGMLLCRDGVLLACMGDIEVEPLDQAEIAEDGQRDTE